MMGFTKIELTQLLNNQNITKKEQEILLLIMKENYDGYSFSIYGQEKVYNSNMCLYLLTYYVRTRMLPEKLIDMNIASDYSKLGKMLDLCQGENREEIMEKVISGEGIVSEITEKFNPAMEFTEKDLVSMLFYLGYLTIEDNEIGYARLSIPNKVMQEIYSEYFLKILRNNIVIN